MKSFKSSKYNFFFKTEEGVKLAFNGISGGFALIKKENEKIISKFIENPNSKIKNGREEKIFTQLLHGRFIVDSSIDELSLLKIRFWNARFNQRNLGITLAPTLNCNFKCVYCYEREKNANKPIRMNDKKIEVLEKFITNQIKNGVKNISVGWYGGEPLLEIGMIEKISKKIIDICNKNQILYNANMITNGYLLTEKTFKPILHSGINFIQITLDGPPDIHNHFRPLRDGSPTFSIILENIKRFVDFAEGKVKVAIRVNVAQENYNAPFELLKILEEEGLKGKVAIYPGQIVSDNSQIVCLLDNSFSDIETNFIESLLEKGWSLELPPLPRSVYCSAYLKNSYTVDPDLNLYKCWEAIGIDKLKVGYIDNDGRIKINEENLHWLSYDPFEFEECRKCKFLPLCMGGCVSKIMEKGPDYAKIEHGECPTLRNNLLKKLISYYKFKVERTKFEGK